MVMSFSANGRQQSNAPDTGTPLQCFNPPRKSRNLAVTSTVPLPRLPTPNSSSGSRHSACSIDSGEHLAHFRAIAKLVLRPSPMHHPQSDNQFFFPVPYLQLLARTWPYSVTSAKRKPSCRRFNSCMHQQNVNDPGHRHEPPRVQSLFRPSRRRKVKTPPPLGTANNHRPTTHLHPTARPGQW